ncbi:related to L-2,4-diaminobutyrate decarboxylase [Rhynchosporium agropyri]|uniref:Related to L-2,4-diaminobutyrate decarboxylase n=1 Tax=Rhynchosporium agropyri TaxID=914238 RepID=A0A1E1KRW9_9HELO|nr:related to L-2,4-diaminobutyrate decarboxylase [Rhynchosporium agropyri]
MSFSVSSSYAKLRLIVDSTTNDALPSVSNLENAAQSLPSALPAVGLGQAATTAHLLTDLTPGFNGPKTSSNYYGFVTGGVFPIAEIADNIVSAFDQNVQVHLSDQSIATAVEDKALSMLVELLDLGDGWVGKTFTTGATGANVMGLACGREAVVDARLKAAGESGGVGELGLLGACLKASIKEIQVLTTMGHSSLYKAGSIVGLGRAAVKDIATNKHEPWKMDVDALERELEIATDGVVSIVALSMGEVNTGRFATDGPDMLKKVREICDQYGAWLHIDGAFGIFARCLPSTVEFATLRRYASGIELADSICGDAHKMLNVPYDCGFFFTRSTSILSSIFQNPNAAYLSAGESSISSPLNNGLENSRRFRALPVYAVLLAYGREGLAEMFARQVRLAREVSKFLTESNDFELLATQPSQSGNFDDVHIIVIFKAKNERFNVDLVKRINATRKMYVSATKWDGKPACRIAFLRRLLHCKPVGFDPVGWSLVHDNYLGPSDRSSTISAMSFGFGVGDFLAVGKLAWAVYKSCKDAPESFNNMSTEVLLLHAVLKEVEEALADEPLTESKKLSLATIGSGCHSVLSDSQILLTKYESMGTQSRRTWDQMKWGSNDVTGLRARLTSNTILLTTFLDFASNMQRRLNRFVEELQDGKHERSVITVATVE